MHCHDKELGIGSRATYMLDDTSEVRNLVLVRDIYILGDTSAGATMKRGNWFWYVIYVGPYECARMHAATKRHTMLPQRAQAWRRRVAATCTRATGVLSGYGSHGWCGVWIPLASALFLTLTLPKSVYGEENVMICIFITFF